MVKRTKSTTEKPKADKGAKHHPKPILEITDQPEPVVAAETTPLTLVEPAKAEPTAVESAGPPPLEDMPALPVKKEEDNVEQYASAEEGGAADDSGRGVGDLLHDVVKTKRTKPSGGEEDLPTTGSGKLTIESIISGKRLPAKPEHEPAGTCS